jgi:2'-5' RNA ligase
LQQVRAKLEALPPPEFGTMTAHEFCLYESHLSPAGARYKKLAMYPLRKPNIDPLIFEENH